MRKPNYFVPKEPSKTYYTFLKDFKLNNPQYLYNTYYPYILGQILSNDTLGIPPIDDMPIESWQKEVKHNIANLIGSENGSFYDMIVANVYARQLMDEIPLSNVQKENIKTYFEDGEISQILIKKNEEVIKLLASEENKTPPIINKTPEVSKEKLIETIISKYKGKAVVVDFWSTWCSPCLEAMKEMEIIKNNLKDKDVIYIYITNPSSPLKVWENRIKRIGGEHYYLTEDEWNYLSDSFGFKGIPAYLFYDADGVLKNKVTGYPGTKKMQQLIEELLP